MNFKNIKVPYLLLIPSVFLTSDFLPEWYSIYISIILIMLSLFKLPTILVYLNFVPTYFIFTTVGKTIIPETTVPILIIFVLSNIIQRKKDSQTIDYLYFFWLGILSIFDSNLYYLIYAISVIIFYIYTENTTEGVSLKAFLRNLLRHKFKILGSFILIVTLFIFFPRFHNFLPKSNKILSGKIGYTKDINNTGSGNIQMSTQNAFYAEIDRKVSNNELYWRGSVSEVTDGYNWKSKTVILPKTVNVNKNTKFLSVKLKYEQDFDGDLILLNSPRTIQSANLGYFFERGSNTYKAYNKKKKAIISSTSFSENDVKMKYSKKQLNQLTSLPSFIPRRVKGIVDIIKSQNPKEIIREFRRYIIKNKFSYTLSPGLLPTMSSFIESKKGYCTHFSSLLGIVLRLKGIPTRLVSGFQGGMYNDIGKYYIIKSNDAHAWVEYFNGDNWITVDPTSFISPNRINLGGQRFFTKEEIFNPDKKNQNFILYNLNYAKLYFDNLNYKVSLFFDNFDRDQQNKLSEKFKLTLSQFLLIGLLLFISLFSLIYYLNNKKRIKKIDKADYYIRILDKKLKKANINLSLSTTIEESIQKIETSKKLSNHDIKKLLKIINTYQKVRYSQVKNYRKLKKMILSYEYKKY